MHTVRTTSGATAVQIEAAGGDEVFQQLALARIIEPTSKQDSLRVMAETGIAAVSYDSSPKRPEPAPSPAAAHPTIPSVRSTAAEVAVCHQEQPTVREPQTPLHQVDAARYRPLKNRRPAWGSYQGFHGCDRLSRWPQSGAPTVGDRQSRIDNTGGDSPYPGFHRSQGKKNAQ